MCYGSPETVCKPPMRPQLGTTALSFFFKESSSLNTLFNVNWNAYVLSSILFINGDPIGIYNI